MIRVFWPRRWRLCHLLVTFPSSFTAYKRWARSGAHAKVYGIKLQVSAVLDTISWWVYPSAVLNQRSRMSTIDSSIKSKLAIPRLYDSTSSFLRPTVHYRIVCFCQQLLACDLLRVNSARETAWTQFECIDMYSSDCRRDSSRIHPLSNLDTIWTISDTFPKS